MNCKICGNESNRVFKGTLLGKYEVDYFHCQVCDFIQTEDSYWLEEAYREPINFSDTGYAWRNVFLSERLSILFYLLFKGNGKYLDYAGGYGLFVRLMRDNGYDFFWQDKYTANLFSHGFEGNLDTNYNCITLFEVLEHLEDPMEEIKSLFQSTDMLVFSTELHPNPLPKPQEWWYYGVEHGQHISIYSKKTFEYIAKGLGLYYSKVGMIQILSKQKIPNWKLTAMRLVKYGFHYRVKTKLVSKTKSDFDLVVARKAWDAKAS